LWTATAFQNSRACFFSLQKISSILLIVIRREDDVDGRANVTKAEERVLQGG